MVGVVVVVVVVVKMMTVGSRLILQNQYLLVFATTRHQAQRRKEQPVAYLNVSVLPHTMCMSYPTPCFSLTLLPSSRTQDRGCVVHPFNQSHRKALFAVLDGTCVYVLYVRIACIVMYCDAL